MPLDESIRWISQYEQGLAPHVEIFMSQGAFHRCNKHVKRTLKTELGGMLVGDYFYDEQAQKHFIIIHDALEGDYAEVSATRMTFTRESQLRFHDRLENEFPGKRFVGWYHSHPTYDIFLSTQDEFTHQHFFKNKYFVALVIDPAQDKGGFFCWQEDGTLPLRRYSGFYEVKESTNSKSIVTWCNLKSEDDYSSENIIQPSPHVEQPSTRLNGDLSRLRKFGIAAISVLLILLVGFSIYTLQTLNSAAETSRHLEKTLAAIAEKSYGLEMAVHALNRNATLEAFATDTPMPTHTPTASGADSNLEDSVATMSKSLSGLETSVAALVHKATLDASRTETPTATYTSTPTNTPEPTDTPTQTDTPIPADTPVSPVETPTAASLETPVQPTDTPLPTNTPTPQSTPVGGLILVGDISVKQGDTLLLSPYTVQANVELEFGFNIKNSGSDSVQPKSIGIGLKEDDTFQSAEDSFLIVPSEEKTFHIRLAFPTVGKFTALVKIEEQSGAWRTLQLESGEDQKGVVITVQ
ncbi:MAG: hypothetical protein DPW11_03220 [bacterium]|nr:hypothetical protein [bacterium]